MLSQFDDEKVRSFLAEHKKHGVDLEKYLLEAVACKRWHEITDAFIKGTYPNAKQHFRIEFSRSVAMFLQAKHPAQKHKKPTQHLRSVDSYYPTRFTIAAKHEPENTKRDEFIKRVTRKPDFD